MNLEFEDIEKLMRFFDETSASELKLEIGDLKFALKKETIADVSESLKAAGVLLTTSGTVRLPDQAEADSSEMTGGLENAGKSSVKTAKTVEKDMDDSAGKKDAVADNTVVRSGNAPETGTVITAPLAGIFYRSPKPGEKPFAEVGMQVKKGQTIGLMEAMKMINEIPAPCDGTVTEILAADGDFVQYETALMVVG